MAGVTAVGLHASARERGALSCGGFCRGPGRRCQQPRSHGPGHGAATCRGLELGLPASGPGAGLPAPPRSFPRAACVGASSPGARLLSTYYSPGSISVLLAVFFCRLFNSYNNHESHAYGLKLEARWHQRMGRKSVGFSPICRETGFGELS